MATNAAKAPAADYFWRRVKVGKADECWPWLAYKDRHGYGGLWFDRKFSLSHRVAFKLMVKDPVGLCVLHRCDNPPCCNPAHLFLGTRRDNVDDRHQKGRDAAPRGEDHHSARLGPSDVIAIRSSTKAGIVLAKKFGVTPQQISRIRHRKAWKHI